MVADPDTDSLPPIDRGSRIPLWQQVADLLRHDMATYRYPPGTRLAGISDLVEHWKVSRAVVERGLHHLRHQGLVELSFRRGVYVAATPLAGRLAPTPGVGRRRGMGPRPLIDAAQLRQAGHTWVQIAAALRKRYRYRPMAAMRLAHGWSQRDAADEWNTRWPDQLTTFKYFYYWEKWPGATSYRPTAPILCRLAELYECAVSDLLEDADFRHLDAHADPDGRKPT